MPCPSLSSLSMPDLSDMMLDSLDDMDLYRSIPHLRHKFHASQRRVRLISAEIKRRQIAEEAEFGGEPCIACDDRTEHRLLA